MRPLGVGRMCACFCVCAIAWVAQCLARACAFLCSLSRLWAKGFLGGKWPDELVILVEKFAEVRQIDRGCFRFLFLRTISG
jgi:hypothetical protein